MKKRFFNTIILLFIIFILWISPWFRVDKCRIYLSTISIVYLCIINRINGLETQRNKKIRILLTLRCFRSIVCFSTKKIVIFWISYELAIVPLLFLILYKSPYSERFVAGWYLVGYVGLTRLPMLLIFVYIYVIKNSAYIKNLVINNKLILCLLCILFLTKVPYPPFHSWLPIVHAEARSVVSMGLSGYVMKLGLVGIYRFCCKELKFSIDTFLILSLTFSITFFFSSLSELDYKRWLAFLRLVHIQITGLGLYLFSFDNRGLVFLYRLGHGLSAMLLFFIFQEISNRRGSRKWLLLNYVKDSGRFNSLIIRLGLLTAASFPITMQFVAEVNLITSCSFIYYFLFPLGIYIFLAGLVPMVILAKLVVNSQFKRKLLLVKNNYIYISLIIIILSFAGFLIL